MAHIYVYTYIYIYIFYAYVICVYCVCVEGDGPAESERERECEWNGPSWWLRWVETHGISWDLLGSLQRMRGVSTQPTRTRRIPDARSVPGIGNPSTAKLCWESEKNVEDPWRSYPILLPWQLSKPEFRVAFWFFFTLTPWEALEALAFVHLRYPLVMSK